jgi:hypothetical protein
MENVSQKQNPFVWVMVIICCWLPVLIKLLE